jgi:circadian clock protein KaiB
MTPTEQDITHERFQIALDALAVEEYALTLFVSGASDASAHAIANVRELCDAHLGGRHELKIVDLHQEPAMAKDHNVLATPTLVKQHPLPLRMLVGDMSDHPRVLAALGVHACGAPDGAAVEATG